MIIPFDLHTVVIGAIIAQGVFAAVLLFAQAPNQPANRFLGLLVLSFSLWLLDTFFRLAHIYAQNPDFYFLPIYYSLAFGPLLYFYTRSLTHQEFSFRTQDAWHFLPVLLQGAFYLYLQGREYPFRRWFWFEVHRPYTYDLEFFLSLLSLLAYLFLSLRQLRRYRQWIQNQFSEISRISLRWLLVVQALLGVLTFLWLVDAWLRESMAYYPDQPFSAVAMGVAVLVLAGGGLLQADLGGRGIVAPGKTEAEPPTIDPVLLGRIQSEMTRGKYYLAPELSLKDFARVLEVPPRVVSTHINQGLGLTFIDFVNQYRVEQVRRHLEKGDLAHLSLLGVALESGFQSKSTFNRVFRKATGQSPSEFQKAIQNRGA